MDDTIDITKITKQIEAEMCLLRVVQQILVKRLIKVRDLQLWNSMENMQHWHDYLDLVGMSIHEFQPMWIRAGMPFGSDKPLPQKEWWTETESS